MKLKRFLIFLVVLFAGCSAEPEVSKDALVKVEGELATLSEPDKATFLKLVTVEADKGSTLRLPGRLVWNEEKTVRIFPQLGGRVQSITVDVGNAVKIGQSLAVLSSPDFGQAQADALKARADAKVATLALERNRQLREAGVIAEKDWQQAEAAAAAAKAEADRANRRLSGLGGDGDGSYILRSPLAGVVVERNLNPGMEFRPEQATAPLFVVTDPASLWIQLDASEADLANLKKGEPLFSLDDTTLRSRLEVSMKSIAVADAELNAASQRSFDSAQGRNDLALLGGRSQEKRAELAAIQAQLSRVEVVATRDGVAVFGDPNDWIGKPVVTGERIMLLADPAQPAMLLNLPVADAIALEIGAPVKLYLSAHPLSSIEGRIMETSYQAITTTDNIAAYRLRASIDEKAPEARLGLRGTAKVYGGWVILGYYVLRRPLASLRAWSGL